MTGTHDEECGYGLVFDWNASTVIDDDWVLAVAVGPSAQRSLFLLDRNQEIGKTLPAAPSRPSLDELQERERWNTISNAAAELARIAEWLLCELQGQRAQKRRPRSLRDRAGVALRAAVGRPR